MPHYEFGGNMDLVGFHVLQGVYFSSGDAADRNNLEAMCHNCLAEALKELGGLEEAEAKARHGLELREKVGGYFTHSQVRHTGISILKWRFCCR
jgi:hypothetical protein